MRHPEFPPSIAQVIKMASDLQARIGEEQERAKRIQQQLTERMIETRRVDGPFRPYPKLWAAFADEPEIITILDNKHPERLLDFDRLTHFSKTFAMRGKEAAREEIMKPRSSKGYVPPVPVVDVSDFPATTAHSWSGDDLDPLL